MYEGIIFLRIYKYYGDQNIYNFYKKIIIPVQPKLQFD